MFIQEHSGKVQHLFDHPTIVEQRIKDFPETSGFLLDKWHYRRMCRIIDPITEITREKERSYNSFIIFRIITSPSIIEQSIVISAVFSSRMLLLQIIRFCLHILFGNRQLTGL